MVKMAMVVAMIAMERQGMAMVVAMMMSMMVVMFFFSSFFLHPKLKMPTLLAA